MVSARTDEQRASCAAEIIERILPALDQEYDNIRGEECPDSSARKKVRALDSRISKLKNLISSSRGQRRAKLQSELDIKLARRQAIKNENNQQ